MEYLFSFLTDPLVLVFLGFSIGLLVWDWYDRKREIKYLKEMTDSDFNKFL